MEYCISGSPAMSRMFLYLMSGFLDITPSPEHGTSQRTKSAAPASAGSGFLPSRAAVLITVMPRRSAPERISESLFSWRSKEYTVPRFSMSIAQEKLFPPGAAQQSSVTEPGVGARTRTARRDDTSSTNHSPRAIPPRSVSPSPEKRITSRSSGDAFACSPSSARHSSELVRRVFTLRFTSPRRSEAAARERARSSP